METKNFQEVIVKTFLFKTIFYTKKCLLSRNPKLDAISSLSSKDKTDKTQTDKTQ